MATKSLTNGSYIVHGIETPCLVTVSQIQHHISVMQAFRKLHRDLDEHGVRFSKETGRPLPTLHQHIYWAQAEYRFGMWINKVLPGRAKINLPLSISELPPIDVLMILHAYMLDPWAYQEDCALRYPQLGGIGLFPFEPLSSIVDCHSFEYHPRNDQIRNWEAVTGQPFVLPFEPPTDALVEFRCPNSACGKLTLAPWMTRDHTGFGEPSFAIQCQHCQLLIEKSNLQCSRFAQDIEKFEANGSILSGTLFNDRGLPDRTNAEVITRAVVEALKVELPFRPEWTLRDVSSALEHKELFDDEIKQRMLWILRSYSLSLGFSRNLIEAVLYHAKFFEDLHEAKWFKKSGNNGAELMDAVDRYHQFLDLVPTCFSPPADIDLVWHTHQLTGAAYRDETTKLLGGFLGHDDEGLKDDLEEVYKESELVWKARYASPFKGSHDVVCTNGGTGCNTSKIPTWPPWPPRWPHWPPRTSPPWPPRTSPPWPPRDHGEHPKSMAE